jgi:hypothetical protein
MNGFTKNPSIPGLFAIGALSVILNGCSSAMTTMPGAQAEGLVYFMPSKNITITMTVDKSLKKTVVVGATSAYPDLSQAYTLDHTSSWLSKHKSDIGVGINGLLTKADSKTTVDLEAIADAIGKAAAMGTMAAGGPSCAEGTYKAIIEAKDSGGLQAVPGMPCSINYSVKRVGTISGSHPAIQPGKRSGVYYRINQPYEVTVSVDSTTTTSIELSPSESNIYFLEAPGGVFASTDTQFMFTDGVPTKYMSETNGELIGALTLPADILESYFEAVGGIFTAFGGADKKEATSLGDEITLEKAKEKNKACIRAIENNNEEAQTKLAC